jgi:hypothetical protein
MADANDAASTVRWFVCRGNPRQSGDIVACDDEPAASGQ